ncbi:MAG: insulinase family protein [candidate division Zixibacteria bacterium]|nr:insulinase family protein [candidate division Zixibacteria bacterium]
MLVLCFSVSVSAEFAHNVKQFELDNGLTILMLEKHTAPVISYYTFFKVGSRNERPGITGISHFFEHMMFNGAKKYGPQMFDLMLESNGGYSNAYTSNNLTVYYEDFSSSKLELIVDMESDRMEHLAFEPKMLESEMGVVKEERRVSIDNDNSGIIWEELSATAFMAHSYSWPVLGWMEDLNSITREDCLKYHRTYYAPNNAVVVIVGDFKADEALELMKRYFGNIKSGPPPPPVVRNEPEQRGPRRVTVDKAAQYAHLMRGYHVGDKDSQDLHALEVLQFILTTGESCRLNQTLVNDLELSLGLYGGFSWGFDPSLFYFYFAVTPGKDYHDVERAVDSVLADIIQNGPTDNELEKAKNSLTANFYKGYKTNNGTAHELGYYQTLYGDWRTMYGFVEQVKAVTSESVKKAAAKYFKPTKATTAVLIPEGSAL